MKLLFCVVFAILFVLNSPTPLSSENQLIVSKRLPKISSTITETQKGQILDGIKGAAQFFKFLQEKNFFSTLTKISSIAGPIFSIVSGILTVAFMFIDIESPEMALMKTEFAQLNSRIDRWGVEFKEIKRKIDWSAVQINFADVENNIISLYKMISDITDVSKELRETHLQLFINNYEINYKASGDVLYRAMLNIDQLYSVNLFRAAQHFMENDRGHVQEFMIDTMTLLTQAIQLEAYYIKLKYDNQEASDFAQSLWEKKLEILKKKMEQVDIETKEKYKDQYVVDLDNLLVQHRSLSNEQFLKMAMDFYNKKYNWRIWFIVVYNPVSGFKDHTVSSCNGVHRFRTHGRNTIISSIDDSQFQESFAHQGKNYEVITKYKDRFETYDYSKEFVKFFRTDLQHCDEADTIASIAWGSGVWYSKSDVLIYMKKCVTYTYCYNTFIFG